MIVTLALLEGSALFAAVYGVIFLWAPPVLGGGGEAATIVARALAVCACCIIAFYYNDLYDLRLVASFGAFASRLLQAFGVALILVAVSYTLFPDARIAAGPFVSSVLIVAGLLLALRASVYAVMRRRPFVERVIILGTSPLAVKLIREIEAQPHCRYAITAIIDDAKHPAALPLSIPVHGPLEHLAKIIEELQPHRILVALAERRGQLPFRQLLEARVLGIRVEDGAEMYERLTGKLAIESLSPSVLVFQNFRKSRLQLHFRRSANLLVGVVGGLLTAPLMALVAFAIALDSRGPVFFTQERIGLRGRSFRTVKFRTMHERTTGPADSVWVRDDDARITRVGRVLRPLRIDELPQLWNIAKGDMDLVGPRPEMADNVKAMSESIPYYAVRHSVRPGLTGWAQIKQGYSVSLGEVTEKVRYDLYYIKHMSIRLDLKILVDTVKIVLFGRGAR